MCPVEDRSLSMVCVHFSGTRRQRQTLPGSALQHVSHGSLGRAVMVELLSARLVVHACRSVFLVLRAPHHRRRRAMLGRAFDSAPCFFCLPTHLPLSTPLLFPKILRPPSKQEFLIVRFLEPILILAKEHAAGKYMLIDEEEEQVGLSTNACWNS